MSYLLFKGFYSKTALAWVKVMQVSCTESWCWEAEGEMYQSIIKRKKKRQLENKLQMTLLFNTNKKLQGDCHLWGFLSHWKERKSRKGSCVSLLSLCLSLHPNPV